MLVWRHWEVHLHSKSARVITVHLNGKGLGSEARSSLRVTISFQVSESTYVF